VEIQSVTDGQDWVMMNSFTNVTTHCKAEGYPASRSNVTDLFDDIQ